MDDIMKPHFKKEYGEAEVKKLEKRVDRLESIKERIENYKSEYLPYFNNNGEMMEWSEMFGDLQYLVQRLEKYENSLKEIAKLDCGSEVYPHVEIAKEALKDEIT